MIEIRENEVLDDLATILKSLSSLLKGIRINNEYSQEEMQCIAQEGLKAVMKLIDQELP